MNGDHRPRDQFPRSSAYVEQPGLRQVSAITLETAYCQVHFLELMCEGAGRVQAARAAWMLDYTVILPALDLASDPELYPPPPDVSVRTWCLAASAAVAAEELAMGLELHADDSREGEPVAWLHPDDVARLGWLLDCVRRVASGGDLLQAARQAHDKHLGRPRRKRAPVPRDWLHGQICEALTYAWFSLLHAAWPSGAPALVKLVDETHRPTWPVAAEGR